MNSEEERRPMLSDEAIRRALRPGTDVGAPADFAATVGAAIAGRPQRRRFWQVAAGPSSRQLVIVGQFLLLLALLLAMVIGAVIAGSLDDKRFGGGPLLVAQSNDLSWIDPQSRTSTLLIDDPRGIFGVARSNGGESVSFWTGTAERSGSTLELVGVDGTGRRVLATNVTPEPVGRGSIDVWSPDDRYLAAAVTADGQDRILVVDVTSGEGRLIGPDDGANNPLWSPDGEWLAFTHEHAGGPNTLAVMRRDGSDVREISTNVDAQVSGPDNWSSDGTWIYFDAGRNEPPSQRHLPDRRESAVWPSNSPSRCRLAPLPCRPMTARSPSCSGRLRATARTLRSGS